MATPRTKGKSRMGRMPKHLVEMASTIAWYERKTLPELIQEIAGETIAKRFAALPKAVRERAKLQTESPADAAK